MLIARTDPDVPKHRGMTYFILDMDFSGRRVRPLRQMTGDAEFNEVFMTEVRIPDANRLDAVGSGWRVATTTLMNERVAIGGQNSTGKAEGADRRSHRRSRFKRRGAFRRRATVL